MVGMEQLLLLNPEYASEEEAAQYPVREAARAVVMDAENNVALLRVANKNYYKLPGGGIEVGEDRISALKRECLEEIGCSIEVVGEGIASYGATRYCCGRQENFWRKSDRNNSSFVA